MKEVINLLKQKSAQAKKDAEEWNKVSTGEIPDFVKEKQKKLMDFHKNCEKAIKILSKK